ncbi:MAG: hypothetical protein ABI142_11580 [Bryocella sp.]
MNKTLRFMATIFALILLVSAPAKSFADTSGAPCVLGYTVGLFNGVWNTEADGMIGLAALQLAVRETTGQSNDTYNNEDVGYQLFYNHTGSTAGEGKWQDVAETFVQRQNELDPSGYFSQQHFYLIWENITGVALSGPLGQASPAFQQFFKDEVSAITTAAAAELGSLTSAPPTDLDYAAQNAVLDSYAAAGRKLLLVAHSQGNLFVNQAYDHIQPVVGSTRVKVVHIAPASPTVRGQYILSSHDLVINALRAVGGATTVQPNNIVIPFSATDPVGHTLVNIYLGIPNGRAQTLSLLSGALSALTAPSGCAVTVSPASSTLSAGGSATITASVNPAPQDKVLNTVYVWSISGNASGSFSTSGGITRSTTTSTPTITYTLPMSVQTQNTDTVSVKVLEAKTAGDEVNAVTLGTGTATVTVAPPPNPPKDLTPWLGTWTCSNTDGYQGIFTMSVVTGQPQGDLVYDFSYFPYFITSDYITINGTQGWDARARTYDIASTDDYQLYSIVGGIFTISSPSTGVTTTCNM